MTSSYKDEAALASELTTNSPTRPEFEELERKAAAGQLVSNRLSDQLARAHDVIESVRAWMQGQIRFREDHPQWRGLVENMRTQVAKCTEVLESSEMEDHSIDPEMKKLQDAVLDPDTTRKVSTISGVEVDPHTKVAAKEAKDEGQPRQQAMAENFRGVRQPEIGDIVLTGLELPGLIGQRKLAIMPALVVAISEDNPSLVGLDAFFPLNSGTPAIGQIWATHATTPTLGAWWWPKKPAPAPQKPSVGRAVHFYPKHDLGGPLHATITAMSSGEVSQLCVLGTLRGEPNVSTGPSGVDTGAFFLDNVPFSETPKPSHWSWPVFVK